MELLFDILKVLGGLIVGAVLGFFLARNYMQKYMKKINITFKKVRQSRNFLN